MKIFMKKLAWKKGNLFCRTKEWKAKLKYIQSKVDVDPYNKELRIEESNTFKEYCDAVSEKFVLHFKEFLGKSQPTQLSLLNMIHFDKTISQTDADWMT
ncbi:hypothetical protein Tco_1486636 [Tanacetum coccineum]